MDGVLADFEAGFLEAWRSKYPERPYIPLDERTTFYMVDQYPLEFREAVQELQRRPGFYYSLPPVTGGIVAFQEMTRAGFDVYICSSPLSVYKHCVVEKYEWVEHFLGFEWTKRIIMTKDKTLLRGDVLIDDRPEITGAYTPLWTQLIFDQPYNRHISTGYRMKWDSWQNAINLLQASTEAAGD
jgi:5'-nucleotidase